MKLFYSFFLASLVRGQFSSFQYYTNMYLWQSNNQTLGMHANDGTPTSHLSYFWKGSVVDYVPANLFVDWQSSPMDFTTYCKWEDYQVVEVPSFYKKPTGQIEFSVPQEYFTNRRKIAPFESVNQLPLTSFHMSLGASASGAQQGRGSFLVLEKKIRYFQDVCSYSQEKNGLQGGGVWESSVTDNFCIRLYQYISGGDVSALEQLSMDEGLVKDGNDEFYLDTTMAGK